MGNAIDDGLRIVYPFGRTGKDELIQNEWSMPFPNPCKSVECNSGSGCPFICFWMLNDPVTNQIQTRSKDESTIYILNAMCSNHICKFFGCEPPCTVSGNSSDTSATTGSTPLDVVLRLAFERTAVVRMDLAVVCGLVRTDVTFIFSVKWETSGTYQVGVPGGQVNMDCR